MTIEPARSMLMSKVKGKDTRPELAVRRTLHGLGGRYSLHRKDLPGCPDIVLPSRKLALFVHGCFWHRHENCKMASTPKTRKEFWNAKFDANVARDRRDEAALKRLGWRIEVIWECETKKAEPLFERLASLLGSYGGLPALSRVRFRGQHGAVKKCDRVGPPEQVGNDDQLAYDADVR